MWETWSILQLELLLRYPFLGGTELPQQGGRVALWLRLEGLDAVPSAV